MYMYISEKLDLNVYIHMSKISLTKEIYRYKKTIEIKANNKLKKNTYKNLIVTIKQEIKLI